ncbi:beta-class carbonic anhydrase [Nocardiopsis trehalosi]|jgi:carbonic anhydrase|uniref:beta-class carbonic anhydrase n=1 Tax=Nocardiopsis trehalosi TaxID=109329 RepID=UPI000834C72C|nr:carbonic anhydrase [Nocardiopsis trehalosi]
MTDTDGVLARAEEYARTFEPRESGRPAQRLAVVACMDARLNPYALLGLKEGDAHIMRNAGGTVTADTRRSLAVSQRELGTNRIILIHHTECGMTTFDETEFKRRIQEETGVRPDWAAETFPDPYAEVRQCVRRIRLDPAIPHDDDIRAFVFDVRTGRLHEVKDEDD